MIDDREKQSCPRGNHEIAGHGNAGKVASDEPDLALLAGAAIGGIKERVMSRRQRKAPLPPPLRPAAIALPEGGRIRWEDARIALITLIGPGGRRAREQERDCTDRDCLRISDSIFHFVFFLFMRNAPPAGFLWVCLVPYK